MRYSKSILVIIFMLSMNSIFAQTAEDNWKTKKFYTGGWLGYGTGFSFGAQADLHFSNHFALGLEAGLVDKAYPAMSLFPKAVFRPWQMEMIFFAGPCIGNNNIYGGFWGIAYGMDIGVPLGSGVLFGTIRSGVGYSFGVGYRVGFFSRKSK
jgi:hypothetical protein